MTGFEWIKTFFTFLNIFRYVVFASILILRSVAIASARLEELGTQFDQKRAVPHRSSASSDYHIEEMQKHGNVQVADHLPSFAVSDQTLHEFRSGFSCVASFSPLRQSQSADFLPQVLFLESRELLKRSVISPESG